MQLLINSRSTHDYDMFLAVKRLPHYRVYGHILEFPDEYADRLGLKFDAPAETLAYRPAPHLFDYQRAIAEIAIRKGRYALFADCGLGKTMIYLDWCRHLLDNIRRDQCILIVSPLMVIDQIIAEARRFYGEALPIEKVPSGDLAKWLVSGDGRLGITNYEAFRHDDIPRGRLAGCVADESSIFKGHYGKVARRLIRLCRGLSYKMGSTGTPAPNDREEYANHALFLESVRSVNEFLARYFVNRGETGNRWEVKPHGLRAFYRHLSHFSIFLINPAAYGWKDNANNLPPIHVHIEDVPLTKAQEDLCYKGQGLLFATKIGGITNRTRLSGIGKGYHRGRRVETNKPEHIRRIIDDHSSESIIVWCLYNEEQKIMGEAVPEAASITGATPIEDRIHMIDDFKAGKVRVLISKPKILGFGLNLQICTRMVFSGLQDSFESFYQATKRCNRYGSTRPLHVHIPVTEIEAPMIETVLYKAHRVQEDAEEQERMFASEYNG